MPLPENIPQVVERKRYTIFRQASREWPNFYRGGMISNESKGGLLYRPVAESDPFSQVFRKSFLTFASRIDIIPHYFAQSVSGEVDEQEIAS
jgi:hypothetical protein